MRESAAPPIPAPTPLADTVRQLMEHPGRKAIDMASEHNEKRFYELVWPHMAAVLRTAQCLTHRAVDAEDLVQETMLKAFKAIHTARDDATVKGWLMTILRHTQIDRVRSARDDASLEHFELGLERDDAMTSPERSGFNHDSEEMLNSFQDEEIIQALRELPREIRWTLLLVDVEGMDYADAAGVLVIPVGTVKSRLYRGRTMLRTTLEHSRPMMGLAV